MIGLVLIASVFLVFGRVTEADFVKWDDDINIHSNPHIGGLDTSSLPTGSGFGDSSVTLQ